MLFLFSIGITKGKWGTLLSALLAFRADYERCVVFLRLIDIYGCLYVFGGDGGMFTIEGWIDDVHMSRE